VCIRRETHGYKGRQISLSVTYPTTAQNYCAATPADSDRSEMSIGWVDPWVVSGRVETLQFFGLGWDATTVEKILKSGKDRVYAFKARLDKIRHN